MILYIDPQANQYKISPAQSDLIKDDWVECQKREDGTYARSYNLDGTPEPDPEPTVNQIKAEAYRRIIAICPETICFIVFRFLGRLNDQDLLVFQQFIL